MHWQDIAIAVAQWTSIIALVPTMLSHDKPALSSSVLTAVCIAVYMICYITLGLWVSAVSAVLLLGAWVVLAVQKWRKDRMVK